MTCNYFNLVPKTRQAVITEMNYLAKFLNTHLDEYCLPDWGFMDVEASIYFIRLTHIGYSRVTGGKELHFIFPNFEKVFQITRVIKSGQYNEKDILKKLLRDYGEEKNIKK